MRCRGEVFNSKFIMQNSKCSIPHHTIVSFRGQDRATATQPATKPKNPFSQCVPEKSPAVALAQPMQTTKSLVTLSAAAATPELSGLLIFAAKSKCWLSNLHLKPLAIAPSVALAQPMQRQPKGISPACIGLARAVLQKT